MSQRRLMNQPKEEEETKDETPVVAGEAFTGPTKETNAEFNLFDWVAGIRQIRRAIPIYQRLDLLADRDLLGQELQDARIIGDDGRVETLKREIRSLTDQIKNTSLNFVLEGVTQSKFQEILEEARQDPLVRDENDQTMYQLWRQIVEPEGLTFEMFKQIDEALPTQTGKLGTAWAQINTVTPDLEATLPF